MTLHALVSHRFTSSAVPGTALCRQGGGLSHTGSCCGRSTWERRPVSGGGHSGCWGLHLQGSTATSRGSGYEGAAPDHWGPGGARACGVVVLVSPTENPDNTHGLSDTRGREGLGDLRILFGARLTRNSAGATGMSRKAPCLCPGTPRVPTTFPHTLHSSVYPNSQAGVSQHSGCTSADCPNLYTLGALWCPSQGLQPLTTAL